MTNSPETCPDATADRLAQFGESVFSEISRLAVEHDAVNLGQGFPDFDGPEALKEAVEAAMRAGQAGREDVARLFSFDCQAAWTLAAWRDLAAGR